VSVSTLAGSAFTLDNGLLFAPATDRDSLMALPLQFSLRRASAISSHARAKFALNNLVFGFAKLMAYRV
jgi:hypothetical protein